MVEVRNVQELLKYVYRNTDACLEVIGKNGKKTWEENKGSVTLNIGFKKFPVISRECFEKISDRLKCRKQKPRNISQRKDRQSASKSRTGKRQYS